MVRQHNQRYRISLTCMQISRRNLILAGAAAPILASCATDITKLRERPVGVLAIELDVCSAAYAVLRAGVPTSPISVSGCADDKTQANAIFQAASLTKPVVAFAALRMVLDGQLDLNAPASRYLSNGYKHYQSVLNRLPSDAYDLVPTTVLSRISVAQLLNHSSGLPNWSSGALSIGSEHGSHWSYSGEGFVLLQSVIEAVAGMGLSAYLEQQVFAPLGMIDTSLVWREAFAERVVSGRTFLGFRQRTRFHSAVAAASLYTTAADYSVFMSAFLANDPLMSLTLTNQVEVDGPLRLKWGLGWGLEEAPGGPYIWQWGNNPGFRAFAMASVASKDGFVIFTNSDSGMPLAASVAQSVLPADHSAFRFSWVA